MMSKKRFVYEEEYFPIALMQIRDVQNNETYNLEDACELLNEQQLVISKLDEHNTGYMVENLTLKKENKALNSIKKFAEDNGINIFYIDTAFRNCWNDNTKLIEDNEQLRKQIQNYEQLIANSYVGEEETLDGFVGKYVIWEDELQRYKNKNEMIDNE